MFKPTNGNYDEAARECFKMNKNTVVSWILTANYLYYIEYESIFSDEVYDKMCKWLHDNYDSVEHENKHMLTKNMLECGTGYNLTRDEYPLRVVICADILVRNLKVGGNNQ